jgi:hypothetical protein
MIEGNRSLAVNCILFLLILLAVVLFAPGGAKAAEPTTGLVAPISTVNPLPPATDTAPVEPVPGPADSVVLFLLVTGVGLVIVSARMVRE